MRGYFLPALMLSRMNCWHSPGGTMRSSGLMQVLGSAYDIFSLAYDDDHSMVL